MKEIDSLDWYNSIKTDDLDDLKLDFAVAVEKAMDVMNKKRIDLAKDLNVSPARITKVLRGDSNLTMELMHKIAKSLDHNVHIHLAPKSMKGRWMNIVTTQNITHPTRAMNVSITKNSQVIHTTTFAKAA